jgi:hypothetical protein
LTDNTWHHVAYVYDQANGGTVSLYVDGVLDSTGQNSGAWAWVADQQLEIGKSHASFWSAYTGFLDDFRIYDRKLTGPEVAAVAGLAATPQIVLTAGGQPQNIVAGDKDSPVFTVKASAVNAEASQISYQWMKDGVDIPGATSSTYSFQVSPADSGKKFSVRMTLPGATPVTSAEATLTVEPELSVIFNFAAEPVDEVIVDSSPSAVKHDGLNAGAMWMASEDGRSGVMHFDGENAPGMITVAAAPELNLERGTIAFWMKSAAVTQTPNAYAMIFDRRTSVGDVIYQDPSGALANQVAGGLNAQATTVNPTDNKWHHVAYTYDQNAGGAVSIYLDGVLNTTKSNGGEWSWPADQQIEIGDSHDSFWAGFTGFLDEFRIYNRVLTAGEIATLAGLGPQPQIVISGQPANLATGLNDRPTLGVTATVVNGTAANLRYQWQREGLNIADATNSTYSFTVTQADDAKKYRVVLSYTGAANVTSAESTVTVLPEFVLHFPFDAEPVGDVVTDVSPGGNNGANAGAMWMASEDGRSGVMHFDGENAPGMITVEAAPNLNSVRGTIAFWMKSPNVTQLPNPYAMIFDRRAMPADGAPVTGGDVIFQLPEGNIANQAEVAGRAKANVNTATKNTTDGQWHHFAYVYDQTARGFVSFYVDGVLDSTLANSTAWYWVPEQRIEIGDSHDAFWSAYTGFLDDFRIYNRVLGADEIANLAGVVTQPKLNLSLNGRDLTVSWSATGFVLQENSDVGNANGWANVTGGASSPVTISIPATGNKFYRLFKP